AGIVLLLVMSVPMFVSAVNGQSIDSSPLGTQTSVLVSALSALTDQIGSLKTDIQSLRQQLPSSAGSSMTGDASMQSASTNHAESCCLQACRTTMAACLAKQPTGASRLLAVGQLDACRGPANDCINRCKPFPNPTVSCEDRCAVSLGACVASVTDQDPAKL